jgi:TRAP-type mannitol/chloroaromatic compound transport system permease small subunit
MADLFGVVVFLLPFMFVVFYYGWPAVARSWGYFEASGNYGGMPGLFLLKSFIIVFGVLVGLQGIAMALRAILVLADRQDLLPQGLRYKEEAEPETAL